MRYFKARLHEMNLNWGVLRLWLAISGIWMILVMGITSYGSAAPISYLKFYRPLSVTDSGNVLYLDEPEWKPALTMVYPPRRELFVFDGVGWRKLSSPVYTEIARAIDSALRGITDTGEKDKNWRTVRMTDMNGSETDIRVSDNFEQLSPREQAQRVDEFIGLVRSPTDKFFTYTFWAMLIAPPVAAGILLFLIAWGLSGFRARAST
jgi:hypothetical protein